MFNKRSIVLILLAASLWTSTSYALVFATVEQTMHKLYPQQTSLTKKNYFLNKDLYAQLTTTLHLDKTTARTNLYFEEIKQGKVISRVFIDSHLVRTLNETILIKVNANNQVEHIEILAFNEPKDYLAKDPWLLQIRDKNFVLDKSIMKQSVKPYLGATLTAQAIDLAVRKVLLLNQWMNQGQL